jgi:hypothetical protein
MELCQLVAQEEQELALGEWTSCADEEVEGRSSRAVVNEESAQVLPAECGQELAKEAL